MWFGLQIHKKASYGYNVLRKASPRPPYIQCNTKLILLGISWEKVVYFWFILIIAIRESMTNIEKAF